MQVKVLPITDRALNTPIRSQSSWMPLASGGVDSRNEKIGKKIREATLEKIPYMLVVATVIWGSDCLRPPADREDLGAMSVADFAARLKQDVDTKAIWYKCVPLTAARGRTRTAVSDSATGAPASGQRKDGGHFRWFCTLPGPPGRYTIRKNIRHFLQRRRL
ncbi:MAG: His/Gly/Thr/Pro-type tRNA ligase C-terminal domain-containing protein [Dysosmobacter welbionis]